MRATTTKKKNSHRGQRVGSVEFIRMTNPPHPRNTKITMVGRNALIEGLLSIEIAPGQINYIVFSVTGFNHHVVISGLDKNIGAAFCA